MFVKYFALVLVGLLMVGCGSVEQRGRRFGQLAFIPPANLAKYKELHASAWPEVLEGLENYHIRNYSIHVKELTRGEPCLFGYFEYIGHDFDGDMAKMMENPRVRQWEDVAGGECLVDQSPDGKELWWSDMEEVFYHPGQVDKKVDAAKVKRCAMVIGLRPEMLDAYVLLHKYTWPEVLNKITEGNIRHYAIYLTELEGKNYLFGYFEYIGDDFEADMTMIDSDPASIAWMKFTDKGCQLPIPTRAEGEWWAMMDEVFFHP
jgi:L-rhamnose mutarotase